MLFFRFGVAREVTRAKGSRVRCGKVCCLALYARTQNKTAAVKTPNYNVTFLPEHVDVQSDATHV